MSEDSRIPWTDNTASPWFGCTMKSPGCKNCYAMKWTLETFETPMRSAYRKAGFEDWQTRPLWGKNGTRVLTKGFWTNVPMWDRESAKENRRLSCFPSLMDWLDPFELGCVDQNGRMLGKGEPLALLLDMFRKTPNTDWLLLTKNIESFKERMLEACTHERKAIDLFATTPLLDWLEPWNRGTPPANIKLGVSAERRDEWYQRVPLLMKVPAASHFVSVEPLLESFDMKLDCMERKPDLIIIGGESGADDKRRDCGIKAITDMADQCVGAGVKVMVKQDCSERPDTQGRIPPAYWAMRDRL